MARDFGFAPNPFYGYCTLATCKPIIRRVAQVGDWVIGTGSQGYQLRGRLVYAMQVTEILDFDVYWQDNRFANKKPNLYRSLKHAVGDNIYHRDPVTGAWMQEDSHHSYPGGVPNQSNIDNDTKVPRMLVSNDFIYLGASALPIPAQFRQLGADVECVARGHKCKFSDQFTHDFVVWVRSLGNQSYVDAPVEFYKAFQ